MTFEDIKKIPLAQYCLDKLGYSKNRGHDSKMWRSLVSPKGHKIITKSLPNSKGHYLFRCADSNLGGSLIDLLLELEGYSLKEIKEMFSGLESALLPISPPPPKRGEDRDNTNFVFRALLPYRKGVFPNYLTHRGLSRKTIEYFGLATAPSSFGLPLYRIRKGKWVTQTSIHYSFSKVGRSQKFFQKGLERRDSFSLLKKVGTKLTSYDSVAIFESPIDALSYAQIQGYPELLYISTCGSITHEFLFGLRFYLQSLGVKNVFLCFDTDESGRSMSDLLEKVLLPHAFKVKREFPSGKDWNEELMTDGCYPRV